MTIKQCNSCKYYIYVKELEETCFLSSGKYKFFMKNKNCEFYKYGKTNQGHKEYFKGIGKEYPFTEIR